jgi:exonuclease III
MWAGGATPMSPAGSKRSTFTVPVKLVTWNVNSLKARLPRVLEFLGEHAPDGMGLRIDLVLLSEALAPGLERAGIERNYRKGAKPSDHAPLVAALTTP